MGRHTDKVGDAYPRAPSQEAWERMGSEERAQVVEALPAEVTYDEMAMPEGDSHQEPKFIAKAALRGYFKRRGRKVYVGSELPVYYPAERRFAPDLLVVLDVETHRRGKWMVSHEGRGLDWVMEVHVGGDRKKDAEFNVSRYARLGIPEYFIFDGGRLTLEGYRLATPEARVYTRMESHHGRFVSEVLGLELQVEGENVRFWAGNAPLLDSEEFIDRLEDHSVGLQRRAEQEARRAEDAERRLTEETQRRDEETRSREELERRLAAEELRRNLEAQSRDELERQFKELQAEMARLKKSQH
ncbi:Uma2 family endonuclease [Corallococcus praedator]|uniref:Uma2 family endonuclease n=1 Tax=Corallococcus praedator TaxID=2316724 RepID=A0ABX9Q7T0_9BACT|nr:Uma2 family endonuclease [Corallococcus sp. CA031C]RKH92766.1 Uma2 family endonuclease [Corallococcus praedator]